MRKSSVFRSLTHTHDFKVCGLVAAVFTPFNDKGELNLDVIEQYVDHLYENQVVNVFVNGTTGEGLSMSIEERKKHAEKWVQVGHGKLDKIIIHVGSHNLVESKDLASHAKEIGASAIAALPSLFYKPQTDDDLVEYCQEIALCAPDLPFYYYHLPKLTGVTFDMFTFFHKAEHAIPNLAGVKFQSTHLMEASQVQSIHKGQFQVMVGLDEVYLGAMAMGIDWAVGSTYNFMPNVVHRMVEAFNRSDIYTARVEQRRIQDVVRIRNKYGGDVGELKEIMCLSGLDVGPPRLPIKRPSGEKRAALKKELEDIGFFYWTRDHLTPPQSPMIHRTRERRRTLHRATSLLTSDDSMDPPSSPKATESQNGPYPHSHGHVQYRHHSFGSHSQLEKQSSSSSPGVCRTHHGSHGRLEKQTSSTSLLTEG